jgi:mono/diheme cytochrome c family protein
MCNRDSSSASTFSIKRTPAVRAALMAFPLAIAGCVSVDSIAPPVPATRGDAAALTDGRRIFLVQCTACHSAEPVSAYSRTRWQEIVGEMADDAKLTAQQEHALRAYLLAVAE